MFHSSLQLDFYDPCTNIEIPLYNRFILSLFVLICRRLSLILSCSEPIHRESIVDLSILFSERRVFVSTCIVVIALCVPRLVILYTQSPDIELRYSIPVTAYQWYWNIRWTRIESEVYIEQLENVKPRAAFLLETTDCRVIPIRVSTTFFITSNDVLHAFSIPAAFAKCDAVPRRLNAITINIIHPRTYYRQCSELCRVRHSYIPIKVEVISPKVAL